MVNRRDFVSACASACASAFAGFAVATVGGGRFRGTQRVPPGAWPATLFSAPSDFSLRIAPARIELSPRHVITTVAYNGTVPGPMIRVREGDTAVIDVANATGDDELVHWHGLHIPADVDGAHEEGTPHIPAQGSRRYAFSARPAGTRWYHTHGFAGHNLTRATYTGQFGFLIVDPLQDPARYDREVFLALHDWDPYASGGDDGYQMVMYKLSSINGRLFGFDDPIRVREGERVLFRVLNASATDAHWIALPGHLFQVMALDGNPVPTPAYVDVLRVAPGERVDAVVTMNSPGVWVLGEPRDEVLRAGMGVIVEYANRKGPAVVTPRPDLAWTYGRFGAPRPPGKNATGAEHIPLVFRAEFHGHGDFEHWTINGKSYPDVPPVSLEEGKRYRLTFDNQSVDDHPVHLHRHSFELTSVRGQPMSGLLKDVVIVPAKSTVDAEFIANNPGATLLHCHQQDHMDMGFMMLLQYPGHTRPLPLQD